MHASRFVAGALVAVALISVSAVTLAQKHRVSYPADRESVRLIHSLDFGEQVNKTVVMAAAIASPIGARRNAGDDRWT